MSAFAVVFANVGIVIAARMPTITMAMRSSTKLKPLRGWRMAKCREHRNLRGGVTASTVRRRRYGAADHAWLEPEGQKVRRTVDAVSSTPYRRRRERGY